MLQTVAPLWRMLQFSATKFGLLKRKNKQAYARNPMHK